jgi:hypothetical protein
LCHCLHCKDNISLKKFIDKISDMEEGHWIKSYKDMNDLFCKLSKAYPILSGNSNRYEKK